jgi:hypothetical protein
MGHWGGRLADQSRARIIETENICEESMSKENPAGPTFHLASGVNPILGSSNGKWIAGGFLYPVPIETYIKKSLRQRAFRDASIYCFGSFTKNN